jgi:hypothetical protein
MKPSKLLSYGYILICVVYGLYIVLPDPEFPAPPVDAIQSQEPADTESPLRKAYFTDYSRSEVVDHYTNVFSQKTFLLPFATIRLNYPPEEAAVIIRDQTRSTYLEELVHPFRESLYVNGFEPKTEKDTILIDGKEWKQKIIVRYVPSNSVIRVLIFVILASLIPLIFDYCKDLYMKYAEQLTTKNKISKIHKRKK